MSHSGNEDYVAPALQGIPEGDDSLRRSLRLVFAAWFFGAAWLSLVSGAALTRYAQLVHLPPFGFGVLAALGFAAALAQVGSSYFLERFGHHKPLFLVAGITHRGLWIGVALIPWVFPQAWWWPGFLLLKLAIESINNLNGPVWYTWMADLVPRRIRGRFFSRRNQAGLVVQLGATLLLGALLDWAMVRGDSFLLKIISLVFTLAAICGMIDFLFFLKVPPPVVVRVDPDVSLRRMLRQPLQDRNFRRFLGFNATLTFATGYIGPYLWLYAFDVVGFSNTLSNILLLVVPMTIAMVSQPFWGRIIDRIGRKPVLIIATALLIHGAISWVLVSREHWFWGYALVLVSTFAWTGLDVAVFNMLLGLSDSAAGRHYSSAYSAVNSVVVAVAGTLSGLFGGFIAEEFRDWHGVALGRPLTYHAILFAISSGLRVFALLWLIGLKDERAFRTRESVRFMALDLYSSVQQVVFLPLRLVRRLGQITYRRDTPGRK